MNIHVRNRTGLKSAVATAIGIGAAVVLIVPSTAQAADVVSQANGKLVSTSLLSSSLLDSIAALKGAQATNTDGTSTVTSDTPLNASVLSGLAGITAGTSDLFGDNGIIKLGGVGQYAQANPDGSSVAFSGTVTQASSLLGIGTTVTPSTLGTTDPGSDAEITLGTATDPLNLGIKVGALAASAKQTADGDQSGEYTLADVSVGVGGTALSTVLGPVNTALTPVVSALNTLLGTSIVNPLAGNQLSVSLDDLLTAGGFADLNSMPAGTDLLSYLPQALVAQITTSVNSLLTQAQNAVNANPLTGILLGTALGVAKNLLNPLLNGLSATLGQVVAPAVGALAQLKVGTETHNSDGSFTETALRLGVGPNASLASVDLADATVGPNAGLAAVPIANASSLGIAGGAAALGVLAWVTVAVIRRRSNGQATA